MLTVAEWQQNDFLNKNNYEILRKQVADFLFYNMEHEAYNLFNELNKKSDLINNINNTALKDTYLKNIQILKFISLPYLDDRLVLNIFKEELVEMLNFDQQELNVKDKIRKKLANMLLVDRDKYKEQLIKALEENEQIIIQGKSEIVGEQKEGSVGNWIKEYYKFIVESNIDRKLAKAEFLHRNSNIAKLNNINKLKIEILLDLYDNWHKSSLTVAGREDPILVSYEGKLYNIYNGEITEIGGKDSSVGINQVKKQLDKTILANQPIIEKEEEKILTTENVINKKEVDKDIKYKNGEEELQVKWQEFLESQLMVVTMVEVEKINQTGTYEMKNVRNNFYHEINQHKIQDALANLFVLAEHNNLRQAFGSDVRYQKFWGGYLEKNNLDNGQFKNDPTQARFLAMFFKYIMEERLKLAVANTVLVGMVLSNLCRQSQDTEYQQMVYGDIESGEFRWNI